MGVGRFCPTRWEWSLQLNRLIINDDTMAGQMTDEEDEEDAPRMVQTCPSGPYE